MKKQNTNDSSRMKDINHFSKRKLSRYRKLSVGWRLVVHIFLNI